MKKKKFCSTFLIAFLISTFTVCSPVQSLPVRMPLEVAIYAVRSEAQLLLIEPIVIVHYGDDQRYKTIPSLNRPMPENPTKADYDELEKSLYKSGARVTLFHGGQKLGIANINASYVTNIHDGGVVDLTASIEYKGTGKPLLAAGTSDIPGHTSNRRVATEDEASILQELSIQQLIEYGLDPQLVRQGAMSEIISSELRKDAGNALIGRFDVSTELIIYRLFVIGELYDGKYRLTLADLQIQHDIDGRDVMEREYVDQLDINNDGVDEIIIFERYYECWGYTVWQFDKKQNRWGNTYQFTAGGL